MEIMLRVAKLVAQGAAAFDTLNTAIERGSIEIINTGLDIGMNSFRRVLPQGATTTHPWTDKVGASRSALFTHGTRSPVDRGYKGKFSFTTLRVIHLKMYRHESPQVRKGCFEVLAASV